MRPFNELGPCLLKVSTWSEEWRYEAEVATVLAVSPVGQRSCFEGATDLASGRKERDVGDIRGAAAVERIKADMMRLEDLRRATIK